MTLLRNSAFCTGISKHAIGEPARQRVMILIRCLTQGYANMEDFKVKP
jgi:hypothetical protein